MIMITIFVEVLLHYTVVIISIFGCKLQHPFLLKFS